MLGIVIPTLNEAEHLPRLLEDLSGLELPTRVVVVDGGSGDATPQVAERAGATVIQGPRGRARQLNAGAGALRTPWLLFLHADVRLPSPSLREMEGWISRAGTSDFGTFSFRIGEAGGFWRFIEFGQRLREGLAGLAYGDQGLLVSRELFRTVGAYPTIPIMEDVEILRRLRNAGRWRKVPAPILTSPRRFKDDGPWRRWIRNTVLISRYLAGTPPERLARAYLPRGLHEEETLLVFAKAPVPGRVKTRLGAEVGHNQAARIYTYLARRVVDRIRGGAYGIRVCYDPPGEREAVRAMLPRHQDLRFLSQHPGQLGERLEWAFREAFRRATRVVVIGTDAPGVDAALVSEAFFRLRQVDLVLGPALDGGYYLLGLSHPAPELFAGIPWSTEKVLERTLERARARGLETALLPPLPDVDTLADWKDHLATEGLAPGGADISSWK